MNLSSIEMYVIGRKSRNGGIEVDVNLDFVILAAGIALAGCFIGNGLRNFGRINPVDGYLDQPIRGKFEERKGSTMMVIGMVLIPFFLFAVFILFRFASGRAGKTEEGKKVLNAS